ncbi:MAG: MFS transporter [Rikenellaceae bacterium]|nr:MFS transporter [Rikenellaceae bacterium]
MGQTKQKSFGLAIAFIGLMFFAIGFAFGINGFLAGPLNDLYGINKSLGYLVLGLSFLPFLLFAMPATATIKKIGYQKTMALSFVFFAVSFALYAWAASLGQSGLILFYVSAFVGGIGNAFLNATANPYISVIGPIDSAAKRICIMGICNKLAYPVAIIFFTFLMSALGIGEKITEASQMVTPFLIIMGIFILLGVLTLIAPLPEVTAEGEDESSPAAESGYAAGKTSIMQFPHAIMGALALFIYTGVETMSLNTASEFVGINDTLDSIQILGKSLLIWFPSLGMVLGYILGVICIPKYMSQDTALKLCSTIGAIGSLGIILFPSAAPWLLLVVAFGCSMGSPAIWPLSLKDLGKFTKTGSALLTMGIAGGAVFPPLFGLLADAYSAQVGYWLCLPCFLFILYFAVLGHKIRTK